MDTGRSEFMNRLIKYTEIVVIGAAIGSTLFFTCKPVYEGVRDEIIKLESSMERMYRGF